MNIADELRELVTGEKPAVVDGCWVNVGSMTHGCKEALLAIADRIDAAYEEALGSKIARAISVGEDGTEFVSMPAKELSERYMELPKDADGEVIHVGDELRDGWHEQNQGEVEWLMLNNHGWWLMLKNNCERFYAHDFHEWHHRHRKPPTVEDVLREFTDAILEWSGKSGTVAEVGTWSDVAAEYAAKLQLKED